MQWFMHCGWMAGGRAVVAPRRPYDSAWYRKERAKCLLRWPFCVHCAAIGVRRRSTVSDHQPPLSQHRHVDKSGCCVLVGSCAEHSAQQGAALQGMAGLAAGVVPARAYQEPESIGPDDPVWRVPWLEPFLEVPENATWPRFMTVPHPNAVGSYGSAAIEWARDELGIEYRWWQRLSLVRELEHDADGNLVWLTVLSTTARQVGKSTKLRGKAGWRLHQAGLFGERQELLHTGKDLPVCRQVIRPMMSWAEGRGYDVRRQNGNEEIATSADPVTASRWIVRGKGSVYGYSGTAGMVDESWGVHAEVVDDGILPTMLERRSPQLELTSTAHRKATMLFPARRIQALEQLRDPRRTLIMEWSAHRDAELGDREAWRQASPHWGPTREDIIADAFERVMRGEMFADDTDDDDPVEAFRAQFLNVWPLRGTPRGGGEPLFEVDVWDAVPVAGDAEPVSVVVAVEDNFGTGAAVATVTVLDDDRRVLGGWLCDGREEALADAAELASSTEVPVTTIVSVALGPDVDADERMGMRDVRRGLSLLRSMVASGTVVRSDDPADVDEQVSGARVREGADGLSLVGGVRSDLVRALVWALVAAEDSVGAPAIY